MFSHEPPDYSCPFCRVASGVFPEDSVRVVHRYDKVFVQVNRKWWPRNRGGLLVIPLEHYENVYDLPPALGTNIQEAVRDAALALKELFECDGISTRQHNEPAGNQDVWHYHVHVFPRYEGDHLYGSRGVRADPAEISAVATALREHWPAATR